MYNDRHLYYCDQCSTLALAELDGEILCTECLLKKVNTSGSVKTNLIYQIEPLTPKRKSFPPLAS